MNIDCPSCKSPITITKAPRKGEDSGGSDAWVCIKCDAVVCVDCYHEHSMKSHPEMVKEIKKRK